jgi:hypothetical protein
MGDVANTVADTTTVYRAVPQSVTAIRDGDWVADEGYALMHASAMADWTGEPWHVLSITVPEAQVVWAGPELDEWYADTGERREFFLKLVR